MKGFGLGKNNLRLKILKKLKTDSLHSKFTGSLSVFLQTQRNVFSVFMPKGCKMLMTQKN